MPVLDNALSGVAATFAPVMLGLRLGRPVLEIVARLTSAIPAPTPPRHRARLDPSEPRSFSSRAGGTAAGRDGTYQEERRKIAQPTLIVGHPRDPLHPFSDSGMLAEELANGRLVEANSILEWRLSPKRLDAERAAFLADVWAAEAIGLR
jgi:hypothetical protein